MDDNTFEECLVVYAAGGVPGPQGAVGIQGFQGLDGIGTPGFQGVAGLDGFQGLVGAQGIQGIEGMGMAGSQGAQGFQGITNGLSTFSYAPSAVAGANLTVISPSASGWYMTLGSNKFAWGQASFRWNNLSQNGGVSGNPNSITFPVGFFTTVQQFIINVSEVGGDAVQIANGDLSGSNTVGQFFVWRPVASGSGVLYTLTVSFLAIGI